jgi:integrase/recombinase XerD
MSDLFDDAGDAWRADPQSAFEAFVVSPRFLEMSKRKPKLSGTEGAAPPRNPIRKSSALVYIAMWTRFLRWLGAGTQGKTVFDVSSNDLVAFLEYREHGKRVLQGSTIRRQYLTLFERVYLHLKVHPNPAVHACFDIFRNRGALVGANAPKAKLSDAEQAAFMAALPAEAPDEKDAARGWKRRRDRAMQALMLGAGLKVSEVVGIHAKHIGEVDTTGSAPVSISPATVGGTVRPHQTQLRPFAVPEVMAWLQERNALDIPGPLLFPATLNGGRLDKATVYRQVKATFARAGIDVPRQGGRTLRNTFAVRELTAGGDIELVGEFMGHRKRRSTEHYLIGDAGQAKLDQA